MDERELARGCKRGDENALRLLYERYAAWMMGISMRYTGNRDVSRDILHDSFVKIIVSLERFEYRGAGSLKVWIGRIVANTAISFLKKDKSFFETDIVDNIAANEESHADHQEIYDSVSDEDIVTCIARLPKRLGVVFNMYMFENLQHSDIAHTLQITEQASRVRLHRAKELLAKELNELISTAVK